MSDIGNKSGGCVLKDDPPGALWRMRVGSRLVQEDFDLVCDDVLLWEVCFDEWEDLAVMSP